jgi:hypothetical protein
MTRKQLNKKLAIEFTRKMLMIKQDDHKFAPCNVSFLWQLAAASCTKDFVEKH